MLEKDYENTPFLYSLFGNWPKINQFGVIIQNNSLWNLKLLNLNQLQFTIVIVIRIIKYGEVYLTIQTSL
jgi:hypothetical protein